MSIKLSDLEVFTYSDKLLVLFWLKAIMLFPKTPAKRDEYMLAQIGSVFGTKKCTASMKDRFNKLGGVRALANAKSLIEFEKTLEKHRKEFETIHMIVTTLYRMSNDKEYSGSASLNKVAFLIEELRKRHKLNLVKNENNIKTTWGKYKPAAHLIASKIMSDKKYEKLRDFRKAEFNEDVTYEEYCEIEIIFVYGIADILAEFLVSFKVINSKDVFMVRKNLVEASVELPPDELDDEDREYLGILGGLTDEEREILKQYEAY